MFAVRNSNTVIGPVGPASPVSSNANGPFSKGAVGFDVSPLGVGLELTTNLGRHLNLRTSGSMFSHPINFTTNGFRADAQLRLASAGTSLDIYPFGSAFRVSPGILFYNQNRLTAVSMIAGGSSFTLDGDTFYSANANQATGATPLSGRALLSLHTTRPAFSITGGWGNPLTHRGHWSFPVEAGVAFVGSPALHVKLAGWACHDQAQTQCADIANPDNPIALQVQSDLNAEVSKWTKTSIH
ncbi:hypothetical protein P8935_00155 [Telmatobacter sp. DSM 110680]|uniref:Uncharacterized protein n=1 Tax=Telmatobacter sp. DSM 110680 TaxID=3036704 RepID=A0AAU7DKA4_9BACT